MEYKNLLKQNKFTFDAIHNDGTRLTGVIRVENGKVYLCQNTKDGLSCKEKYGFTYSWVVGDGSPSALSSHDICSLMITQALGVVNLYFCEIGNKITSKSQPDLFVINKFDTFIKTHKCKKTTKKLEWEPISKYEKLGYKY
jgi:predicted GTPase